MASLKCILVGFVAGTGAAILWAVGTLLIPMAVMMVGSAGSGGIGAVSVAVPGDVIVPWLVGFAIGFALMFRRQRRRASIA